MNRTYKIALTGTAALAFMLGAALSPVSRIGSAAPLDSRAAIPAQIADSHPLASGDFGSPLFNAIEQRGVLRVGTLADYPPIASVNAQTGQQVGFENDLARDMAAAMGVKVQFVDVPFATLIAGLQAGKFDIIAAQMAIKASRALAIDFTKPWEAVGDSVVVLKSSGIRSVADLNKSSRTITVNLGSVEEQTKDVFFPQAKKIEVNAEPDGFLNVLSKRADGFITDNVSVGYLRQAAPRSHRAL